MHYYKRDLTPVKEIFASCNERTPYRSNFQDYEGSLISQGFKDELLKGLGEGVKCVTQSSGGNDAHRASSHTASKVNRSIQTFLIDDTFKSIRSQSQK